MTVNKILWRANSFGDPNATGRAFVSLVAAFPLMMYFRTSSAVVTLCLWATERPGRQLLAWDNTVQRNCHMVSSIGGSSATGTRLATG